MKEVIRIQNRPDGRVDVLNLMEGGDEAIVLVRGLEPNKSLDLVINTQTSVSVGDVVELDVLKKMQGHSVGEKFPTNIRFDPQSRNMGIYASAFSITLDFSDGSAPEVYLIVSQHALITIIESMIQAHIQSVTQPCYLDDGHHFRMELIGANRWKLTCTDNHGNLHHYKFSHRLIANEWDRLKKG